MVYKTINVSAPGKVILFGEHAVVYEKKALATSLNLRTRLKLVEGNDDAIVLVLPTLKNTFAWKYEQVQSLHSSVEPLFSRHQKLHSQVDEEVLEKLQAFINQSTAKSTSENLALLSFFYLLLTIYHKCPLPRLTITVTSELPVGAGLGSSASYCVCLASALLTLKGNILTVFKGECLSEGDKELINRWSLLAEMVVHGRPSGVDNSVVSHGKALEFKAGQMTFIQNMPHLKILFVDTRVSRSSKAMVAKVKDKHDKYPVVMESLMHSSEAITLEAIECLQSLQQRQARKAVGGDDGDFLQLYSTLDDLVEMAQGVLRCLGVSHEAIEEALVVLHRYTLSGKLTGAGGGGCIYAVLPPNFSNESLREVQKELEEKNFACFESCIGGSGVEISVE